MLFEDEHTQKGKLITSELGNFQLVSFKGELIYGIVENIKEQLTEVPSGRTGYIFDMLGVTRIDSTGFGVIVTLSKRLFEKDTRIVFVVNNPLINDLFVISQFHKVFPIVKNVDEAQKLLESNEPLNLSFSKYLNMSNSMRKK